MVQNIHRKSLINENYNSMSSPDVLKTFLFYLYVKCDTR